MMADTIRYAFLDGGSYAGHCEPQTSLAHGRGKRIFDDDSTYDGSWNEGRMEGHGVMKFGTSCPSLYSFEGNWVNNKFQGEGTLLYRYFHVAGVQAKFEGEFHDGKRHGNGLGTFADGESYEGGWEDDKRQGFGSQIWRNGERYVGQWKEDARNGFGVHSGPRGDYEGQWKGDKRHGVGKQTELNGDCYEGEWKNDQRHGVGILRWGTGHCYSGGWQRDKRHCVGTQEWSNGDHYTGEWEGDQPVGFFGGDIVFSSPSPELTIVRGKVSAFGAESAKS